MEDSLIKCRAITLVTNGLAEGTQVLIDGKEIPNVKSCHIDFDKEDTTVDVTLETIEHDNVEFRILKFENGNQFTNGGKG